MQGCFFVHGEICNLNSGNAVTHRRTSIERVQSSTGKRDSGYNTILFRVPKDMGGVIRVCSRFVSEEVVYKRVSA